MPFGWLRPGIVNGPRIGRRVAVGVGVGVTVAVAVGVGVGVAAGGRTINGA